MKFHVTPVEVRLSEVDAFGVVWHGRYVEYFEVGRTDLLRRHGLSAADLRASGYFPAVVHLECDLLATAHLEERLIVRSRPIREETAKLSIQFEIGRAEGAEIVARGRTTQVLLDSRGVLLYRFPEGVAEKVEALLAAYAS